ncbi:MAG: hypothetical protein CML22_06775 [Rheinheimera sp.]|nr:hypothetical protein [Rheinheimera sp.]MBM33986.1 hypothetical protein [Rheinheimera sp.]
MALVETDYIKMEINAQAGLADGEILQGQYSSQKLSQLNNDAIKKLIEHAPDKVTSDLISAYWSFKSAKSEA